MKSMYASYLEEREEVEVYETEYGFVVYKINGDECYLKDLYVSPDFRQSKIASNMADIVAEKAREYGCKFLTGTVCPTAKGATASLKVLLGYGMSLYSSHENLIVFKKDL